MRHQVKVIFDKDAKDVVIRRALLFDSACGLVNELATTFVFRQYPQRAPNTHKALLLDLAFYFEWRDLRQARSPNWVPPERRPSLGLVVISDREITDFCRWSAVRANALASASARPNVRILPVGEPVDASTANRRMATVARFLSWIAIECTSENVDSEEVHQRLQLASQAIKESFARQQLSDKKAPPVRSLDPVQTRRLREAIVRGPSTSSPCQARDHLILHLLYKSGVRAGELLKLWCDDVTEDFAIPGGGFTGCVTVMLRPGDVHDDRRSEPAAKTLPGLVPIAKDLATAVIEYVVTHRQVSVEAAGGPPTPYLFVCHSGPRIGKPMSQRNLNRIIAKYHEVLGFPADFSPHVLRHTHLNEMYERAENNGIDPRQILLQRGRWSTHSEMPGRYASRSIAKRAAQLVAARERSLENP